MKPLCITPLALFMLLLSPPPTIAGPATPVDSIPAQPLSFGMPTALQAPFQAPLSSLSHEETSASFSPCLILLSAGSVALGTASHYQSTLIQVNQSITDFFWREWHYKQPIDNILQLTPLAAIGLLKACGVSSQHNWTQLLLLTAGSYAVETLAVQITKRSTLIERPDGSNLHTFPSGHTAFAFTGAEILRLEYRDQSPWIGVAGYAVATTTGLLRIYNKCHWAGDVLAGAGIGILSAQLNYYVLDRLFQRRPPQPVPFLTHLTYQL